MGHGHEGHECGCGHDHCEDEGSEESEFSLEDLAFSAHNRIDALIELLIAKKVITEKEYEQKIEEIVERDIDGMEEDSDEEKE